MQIAASFTAVTTVCAKDSDALWSRLSSSAWRVGIGRKGKRGWGGKGVSVFVGRFKKESELTRRRDVSTFIGCNDRADMHANISFSFFCLSSSSSFVSFGMIGLIGVDSYCRLVDRDRAILVFPIALGSDGLCTFLYASVPYFVCDTDLFCCIGDDGEELFACE